MNENNELLALIKSQVDKAKSLFTEKDLVEVKLKEIFGSIKDAMLGEINFIFETETDRYGDLVTTIYATNSMISKKYIVITYDFDNKSVFPVKISDMDDVAWLCHDLDSVNSALSNMISNDDFMIRLVSISKERETRDLNLDDDIPF